MSKKLIFIHALSQRCGHNFLAKIIREGTDIDSLFFPTYEVSIPLVFSRQWQNINESKHFIRKKDGKNKELMIAVNGYRDHILKGEKSVLMKNPTLTHKSQVELFQDDLHIILVRDVFNLFVSVEKSIYNFRANNTKNTIKRILRPFYSYYYLNFWSKNLSKSIRALKDLDLRNNSKTLIVKYKDLKKLETQQEIFDHIHATISLSESIVIESNEISSFLKKEYIDNPNLQGNYGDPLKRFENAPWWLKIMIRLKLTNLDKQLKEIC